MRISDKTVFDFSCHQSQELQKAQNLHDFTTWQQVALSRGLLLDFLRIKNQT
jgi:hypothetical protein